MHFKIKFFLANVKLWCEN